MKGRAAISAKELTDRDQAILALRTEWEEISAYQAMAYLDGAIDWKKPVSCHLYPVRTREYSEFTAVNYHRWEICDPACALGEELNVPIYKFVKDALIRKFGAAWYQELEEVAREKTKS